MIAERQCDAMDARRDEQKERKLNPQLEHDYPEDVEDAHASLRWLVTYETAVMSRWPTEEDAWFAHAMAIIQGGLDPDKLAVVRK